MKGGKGIGLFVALLVLLGALSIMVGFWVVPIRYLGPANFAVTTLFMALPILALFAGASFNWTWSKAVLLIAIGALLQLGGVFLADEAHTRLLAGVLAATAQAGLIGWCMGLGALLASILKDKNLLLPLAIFLALFDVWLVFVPEGPVGKIARGSQRMLSHIAYRVPMAVHVSQGGRPTPLAYVGPADFVFLAMFFVALYRFKMRPGRTFVWILPVLVLYLFTVLMFGWVHIGPISLQAMPALLPIGLVVLVVNRREFKLTKDERLSTALVAMVGMAVVGWRLALHWHG